MVNSNVCVEQIDLEDERNQLEFEEWWNQENGDPATIQEIPPWLNENLPESVKKEQKIIDIHNHLDIENPYRRESRVDLTKEKKSFRWIETNVLRTLLTLHLTGSEFIVFFYILDRTRGYCGKNKVYRQTDDISKEDIHGHTGLTVSTVYRTLTSLEDKKLIYKDRKGKVGINFRYDTWQNDVS